MPFRRWFLLPALVLALTLYAVGLAGCDEGDQAGETTSIPGPPPTSGAAGETKSPGLYDLGGTRREAYGFLEQIDLEGGFWALIDAVPGAPFDEEEVVVVVANPDAVGFDWAGHTGDYLRLEGTILEGVSVRMAGPELRVDSVEVIATPPPAATGGT